MHNEMHTSERTRGKISTKQRKPTNKRRKWINKWNEHNVVVQMNVHDIYTLQTQYTKYTTLYMCIILRAWTVHCVQVRLNASWNESTITLCARTYIHSYIFIASVCVCVCADIYNIYVLYVYILNTSLDTLSSKINDESGTLSIIER